MPKQEVARVHLEIWGKSPGGSVLQLFGLVFSPPNFFPPLFSGWNDGEKRGCCVWTQNVGYVSLKRCA